MKGSIWKLLALLLALAAAVYFVLQRPGEQSSSGAPGTVLLSYDSAAVDRVEVAGREGRTVLVKEAGSWQVVEPLRAPADRAAVTDAVGKGRTIELTALVSSNPAKQGLFAVDSTGTVVRFFRGGTLLGAFVMGKAGPSFTETYVRRDGSEDVHLAAGLLSGVFVRPVRDWRDKSVTGLPREAIRTVAFRYGDTTFTLAMADSLWLVGGKPADRNAVDALIGQLAGLQADGFIDSAVTTAAEPWAVIDVDGTQIMVHRASDDTKMLVHTSRSPQWFEVQKWRLDPVLKRESDLLAPGP